MTLVRRASPKASGPFVVDADALPQTIEVVRTRAEAMGIEVVVADLAQGVPDGDVCGVLLQYPGASGRILDPRELAEDAAAKGAKLVVAADLLALTLLESPGELGADVVVGSTQRFGVPLFYGGPHAGYMAVAVGSRAAPAGPAGRRVRRRRGPARLPARAADPRAAHPSRQGDVQHLHRPGAARRRRLDVRRLPRAGGAARDRAADPPVRRRARRRAARGRRRGACTARSSTRCWPGCPDGPPRWSPRRMRRVSSCAWSTPTTSASPAPSAPTSARSRRVLRGLRRRAHRARRRRHPHPGRAAGRAAPAYAVPGARGVQQPPLRDPDAALPAPAVGARLRARPRHDPARLLHDEAQRDHRDGAGVAAGLRRPAPVRARRGRRSATGSSSTSSRAGWPRSPATTGSRSSRTPARRASWPGCSRSAATTAPAARARATSA